MRTCHRLQCALARWSSAHWPRGKLVRAGHARQNSSVAGHQCAPLACWDWQSAALTRLAVAPKLGLELWRSACVWKCCCSRSLLEQAGAEAGLPKGVHMGPGKGCAARAAHAAHMLHKLANAGASCCLLASRCLLVSWQPPCSAVLAGGGGCGVEVRSMSLGEGGAYPVWRKDKSLCPSGCSCSQVEGGVEDKNLSFVLTPNKGTPMTTGRTTRRCVCAHVFRHL